MKKLVILFAIFIMAASTFAQELPADLKPGITPDSPFYFLDTMFDGFQSAESLADEKAAEIVAMAQENKIEALERARGRYEKAMEKRNIEVEEETKNIHGKAAEGLIEDIPDAETAEEVTRQASRHMEILSEVYDSVPEEAKQGIEEALKNSAHGRENAIQALNETNPEKAAAVARETLAAILEKSPEQAKEGLQRALASAGTLGPEQSGEAGGFPSQDTPEEPGMPDIPR